MNEHSGNSGQLEQPDAAGGGDARAQFEAWAHAQSYGGGNIITDRHPDHPHVYACPLAQLTWRSWLAARQPVGAEPVAWQWRSRVKGGAWDAWENGRYGSELAPFMEVEHRALYAAPPAPAAVPVDDKRKDLIYRLYMARDMQRAGGWSYLFAEAADALETTHPQPAAATGVPELFVQWLEREMPAGTIIGKPAWWAPKLARALRSAECGVLGGCNG
ncbi:hypothetical protein QY702_04640 [Xanthomonas campestris pv. plantaginis]|uniref:hypothetical protein n=1 Tax=Xanthomonas campestris TaxID=339 RepID=UPI002B22749D|nr:hypothetical protein [Xanthomonas campestris]MEA9605756.1 hypothetical protein [Xanthomonas campestris pv. plantaginis]